MKYQDTRLTSKLRRRFLVVSIVALGVATFSAAAVHYLSDNARDIAIGLLEKRFDRRVELEELSLRIFPNAEAKGRGLIVHQKPGLDHLPPFITIDTLLIDLSLWRLLLVRPIAINDVNVQGLEIHIPPGRDGHAGKKKVKKTVPRFVFLLKIVDPFFRGERGKGSTLPIKITGTRNTPKFGLDLG